MGSLGELLPLFPLSFSQLTFVFCGRDNAAVAAPKRLLSLEMALGIGEVSVVKGKSRASQKVQCAQVSGGKLNKPVQFCLTTISNPFIKAQCIFTNVFSSLSLCFYKREAIIRKIIFFL